MRRFQHGWAKNEIQEEALMNLTDAQMTELRESSEVDWLSVLPLGVGMRKA